jgi:hypothetical protein
MAAKEYGDFQTPKELSDAICHLVQGRSISPKSLLEPTCGTGGFVHSALEVFEGLEKVVASDINQEHIKVFESEIEGVETSVDMSVSVRDFFNVDWKEEINALPRPVLVIGNPPWVTNADIGKIRGENLPEKTNFQKHKGFDALTGKSNFDISEWIIIRLLEALEDSDSALAMLCKRASARRVLQHYWREDKTFEFSINHIDSSEHFGVSTEACLFFAKPSTVSEKVCRVYTEIGSNEIDENIGYKGGELVSDIDKHLKYENFTSEGHSVYRWRSGIKHDCTRVMQLTKTEDGKYKSRVGGERNLEDEYIYPLLKSSDIANGSSDNRYYVIVPNESTNSDVSELEEKAPELWDYLNDYAEDLDGRGSSIYNGLPRFAVFGVGDYSFSPWKVAVSGLYDNANFTVVPPSDGKPVMVDDTCYFLQCQTEKEAELLADIFNSDFTQKVLDSIVFWDDQRPIKISVLKKIDILKVADHLGVREELVKAASENSAVREELDTQMSLM